MSLVLILCNFYHVTIYQTPKQSSDSPAKFYTLHVIASLSGNRLKHEL